MEECGLLFQITVKPQRDLGSLLLPIARERGRAPRLHMKYEYKSHHVGELFCCFFFLVNCILCA